MANVTITQLPAAGPIVGTELVPIVQDGQTRQTTTAAIAASPAQFQTFLTLNQEPTLPNSRRLAVGTGLGLADGGALSTLSLSLNGASGALETALTGIVAKTDSATVVARTLTVSGLGMSITNGGGVAGNPTFALTGMVSDLANVSSPGLLASNGTGLNPRVLLGTTNEIDVTNGTGSAGNPTVGLADNPVVPGVASMVLPQGTTAQRAAPGFGAIRYNNETKNIEAYTELIGWGAIISGAGISTFSAGATGLSPSTPQTGNIVLSGVLLPANGGTGVSNSHTITLGGAVSTAGSFTTSGAAVTLTATGATNVTLPTTGTLATLAGSEVLTNKSISGATNTLSNIGNGSLTNSSVTFNGTTVALGSSGTITANTTNALTVGTGLQLDSGTTFNGSAARTISLTSPVAVSLGGTGLTSYAAGDITYASAATTLTKLPLGTAGHVLIAGATAPQWGAVDGGTF